MSYIFHIVDRDQWLSAKEIGMYQADSLSTEGFIHCSTVDQVVGTGERYYMDKENLVLLQIQEDLVQSPIEYENDFPHIYGVLNTSAVVGVFVFTKNVEGNYQLPLQLRS